MRKRERQRETETDRQTGRYGLTPTIVQFDSDRHRQRQTDRLRRVNVHQRAA